MCRLPSAPMVSHRCWSVQYQRTLTGRLVGDIAPSLVIEGRERDVRFAWRVANAQVRCLHAPPALVARRHHSVDQPRGEQGALEWVRGAPCLDHALDQVDLRVEVPELAARTLL